MGARGIRITELKRYSLDPCPPFSIQKIQYLQIRCSYWKNYTSCFLICTAKFTEIIAKSDTIQWNMLTTICLWLSIVYFTCGIVPIPLKMGSEIFRILYHWLLGSIGVIAFIKSWSVKVDMVLFRGWEAIRAISFSCCCYLYLLFALCLKKWSVGGTRLQRLPSIYAWDSLNCQVPSRTLGRSSSNNCRYKFFAWKSTPWCHLTGTRSYWYPAVVSCTPRPCYCPPEANVTCDLLTLAW